jgi:hypothetical protein
MVPGRGLVPTNSVYPQTDLAAPAFVVRDVYFPEVFAWQVAPWEAFRAFDHEDPDAWWRQPAQ